MPTVKVAGLESKPDVSVENLISALGSESGANAVEHASRGFRFINSGETHTPTEVYHTIQVLAEATVDLTNAAGGDNLSSVALPAGTVLYGAFTDISVTSGTVVAYILGKV